MIRLEQIQQRVADLKVNMYESPVPYLDILAPAAPVAAAAVPMDMRRFQRSNFTQMLKQNPGQPKTVAAATAAAPSEMKTLQPAMPWHRLTPDRQRELILTFRPESTDAEIAHYLSTKKRGTIVYDAFKQRIVRIM